MGKSWLLTELARRLSQDHEPRHLVGFAESAGETPDLLLRTVIDLYARWLSDADYWQQAKMVWEQQKPNLLPGVARTVARIFKEIAGKAAKPVAVAVEDAINGLIAADQSLKTGGVQLPTLSYEQARDLVAAVAAISDSRSRSSSTNGKNRRTWRAKPRRWMPSSAIWTTGRTATSSWRCAPTSPPTARCRSSKRASSARSRSIPSNRCSSPTRPSRRAWSATSSGTSPPPPDADDETLLDLVEGYPGVLYQWTNLYQREHMRTRTDLARVAAARSATASRSCTTSCRRSVATCGASPFGWPCCRSAARRSGMRSRLRC